MSCNTSSKRASLVLALVAAASLSLSGAGIAPLVHVSSVQTAPEAVPPGAQFFIVPAYFHPTWAGKPWERMCKEKRGASVAIMNPADGPGKVRDDSYTKAIEDCQDKDWRVVGYVSTRWGERPLEEVLADINKYRELYPRLNGIFVDEMETDPSKLSNRCIPIPFGGCIRIQIPASKYYESVYKRARDRVGEVIGNPGAPAETGWQLGLDPDVRVKVADTVNVVEETEEVYRTLPPLPSWVKAVPHYQIAQIIHHVNPAAIKEIRNLTREGNAGLAYVTDKDNLWKDLPSDW